MYTNHLLEKVRKMRSDGDCDILITGANGFLGSHLAAALHRCGFTLRLLCRAQKGESALERMRRVLAWHEIEMDERIEVVEGDVCAPSFGLPDDAYHELASKVTEIIHSASSTSFEEGKRTEIEHINITGTRQCIDFARDSGCLYFHYISTAYVAGKDVRLCEEDFIPQSEFHNPYESSKHLAERMVREACENRGFGYTIYRPSIIIGHSSSGKTLLFNAMYYPVKVLDYLQSLYRKDFDATGGRNAVKMSVQLDRGTETLHMPIRIDTGCEGGGVLNLVPIDYVVNTFLAIFRAPSCQRVHHIVQENPAGIDQLIGYIERYYKLRGIEALRSSDFNDHPKTSLERRFDSFVRIYIPYMADQRVFSSSATREIQEAAGIHCPEITYELFERLIDYAVACDWSTPINRMELEGV